jgi:hypothetical protein
MLHAMSVLQQQHHHHRGRGRARGGGRNGGTGRGQSRPLDVVAVARKSSPTLQVFGVLGAIGVGKSTLLRLVTEEAEKQQQQDTPPELFATYPELVNETHLGIYIYKPAEFAKEFQMTMMHGSCTRTTDAYALMEMAHRFGSWLPNLAGVVIERPAQENVTFAVANHRMGWMTDRELELYRRTMGSYARSAEHKPPGHGEVIRYVQIWAPEYKTLQGMIERKRLAEDAYKDSYLCTLFDCNFLTHVEVTLRLGHFSVFANRPGQITPQEQEAVFERLTNPARTPWKQLHLPTIVNWSEYGTWSGLREQLAEREHARASGGEDEQDSRNVAILFELSHAQTRQSVADSAAPGIIISGTADRMGVTMLDLSWYVRTMREKQSSMDYHRLLANFRDHYFEARSRDAPVYFVVDTVKDIEHFVDMLHFYDGPLKEQDDLEDEKARALAEKKSSSLSDGSLALSLENMGQLVEMLQQQRPELLKKQHQKSQDHAPASSAH